MSERLFSMWDILVAWFFGGFCTYLLILCLAWIDSMPPKPPRPPGSA